MLLVNLRDLLWRRKRLVVAIVGTSVVIGLTLVLAGVSASFPNEARRTVAAFHARAWIVPVGTDGPFMSSSTLRATEARGLGTPVTMLRETLRHGSKKVDTNLLGVVPGAFTDPPVVAGRAPRANGEVTTDTRMHIGIGSEVTINRITLRVVGMTSGITYRAGVPGVYVSLHDAQAIAFGGQPLATAIAASSIPSTLPVGLVAISNADARKDLLAPIVNARKTINLILGLLWLVAGLVIGSVVYLSSLDRVRDFAVFKAVGATDRVLVGGVVAQALLLGLIASIVGSGLSRLMTPVMPMKAEIAAVNYALVVGLAAAVAFVASISAIRRVLAVDPALAFGA